MPKTKRNIEPAGSFSDKDEEENVNLSDVTY